MNQEYTRSPISGQMMSQPLLISTIIRHADRHFANKEIVSRRVEGDIHRYTYAECHARARKMANALRALGVQMGDRIGTLAWNGYRHLELYYAISGIGAVMNTINPRLHQNQIAYIANHAQDQYLFFDLSFLELVERIAPHCPSIKGYVLMSDAARMPAETTIPNLLCYEELVSQSECLAEWPQFDEHAASTLCYTSGTTGNPKGALYSHRSTILHAYASSLPDGLNISSREVVMPVVPMFHVNAWGLPYSAALNGAKLVLPGPSLDGESLHALCEQEGVTFSAGVPTVWLGLLNHMESRKLSLSALRRVVIGGSACAPALMDTYRLQHGVELLHSWGMTEMSPLGTVCTLQNQHLSLPEAEQQAIKQKQGHVLFGVDMKIVDDLGKDLPWDGKTPGHLHVKGQWVIDSYFGQEDASALQDGWLPTGDVATIDGDGYMQITDRSKDVIKSGGEWIGSIDIENIALDHPAVQQAACVGIPHPKWAERPLLVVVRKPGMHTTREDLIHHYEGKVAKWWTPDDVAFVDSLPTGATGKVLKNLIRDQFKNHPLPNT
ncbi:3-(methylthio)propionyl-CoA ligase [Noviherbaspirillum galbum]|uniref:Long-chain-fatty-acid--CoA ligase n=1 Tax=Noviherbaspirillum galbum TaxID=2709383 RepID=A0A6B3SVM8_9BURK|nr:3-(methylthio)propionyl-CoA ligase [Noviherbaspirillum galbum]NEX62432.1 long-chain-fatty-acid--CoA ligase [Noviherbaspirillum galbum]